MMTQGSSNGDSPMGVDAFGFGGEVTMTTPEGTVDATTPTEGETVQTNPSDVTAEGTTESVPQKTEQPTGESEPTAEDTTVSEDSSERRMVIDTIETKLDKFDQGNLSKEELEAFFTENEEIARIANKSKRVKERYRAFTEGNHPKLKEETPAREEALKEEVPTLAADAPLTAKDLENFFEKREAERIERTLKGERRQAFERFATNHNVVDAEATSLEKTANALMQVHADWEYGEALKAAYRANGGELKPKPVQVVGRGLASEAPVDPDEKVDLSEGSWSIDPGAFGMG